MAFWRWVEERIEAAIKSGEFDSLSGSGHPIKLKADPFSPPEERLARHVMQNAGVKPAWVELADEIQAELSAARGELLRAASRLSPDHPGLERAVERLDQRVQEINVLIKRNNLVIPHPRLARGLIKTDKERQRLLSPDGSEV